MAKKALPSGPPRTLILAATATDAAMAMTDAHLTIAQVQYVATEDYVRGVRDPRYIVTKRFWDRPDCFDIWHTLRATLTNAPDISSFPDEVQGLLNGTGVPQSGPAKSCQHCGTGFYGMTKLCPKCNLTTTSVTPISGMSYASQIMTKCPTCLGAHPASEYCPTCYPDGAPEPKEFKHIEEPPPPKKRFKKIKP